MIVRLAALYRRVWAQLPPPARTVINVGVGAGLAYLGAIIVAVIHGGQPPTLKALLAGLAAAAGTAMWRALNPVDDGYGVGSTVPAPAASEPPVEVADR